MPIKSVYDVQADKVDVDGAKDVSMRLMISEADKAPNFNLRVFDVAPGGNTPHHQHNFEHELFFLEGTGEVLLGEEFHPVKPYDTVLIEPNLMHTIKNTGNKTLRLICLVPQDQQ